MELEEAKLPGYILPELGRKSINALEGMKRCQRGSARAKHRAKINRYRRKKYKEHQLTP